MINVGFHINGNQPSKQLPEITTEIYHQSYCPILKLAEEDRNAFFSFNLTRTLGQCLPGEFMDRLSNLVRDQRMEPVNVASDHYLLPQFPHKVVQKQLERNRQFYQEKLGIHDRIPGIFLPELAYDPSLPRLFASLGYEWCLADDEPRVMQMSGSIPDGGIPLDEIFTFDGCGTLLRSRLWSNPISWGEYHDGSSFAKELLKGHREWRARRACFEDSYIILAVDWETFGRHHKDAISRFLIPFFGEIAAQSNIAQITQLDYIFRMFPKTTVPTPLPAGSWSTENLKSPFHLWNSPDNPFHRAWNEFKDTVFAIAPDDPEPELDELLQSSFYSCPPWWATKDDPKERAVAGWCLPSFKRIIELLPNGDKIRLWSLLGQMEHWVARNKIAP